MNIDKFISVLLALSEKYSDNKIPDSSRPGKFVLFISDQILVHFLFKQIQFWKGRGERTSGGESIIQDSSTDEIFYIIFISCILIY